MERAEGSGDVDDRVRVVGEIEAAAGRVTVRGPIEGPRGLHVFLVVDAKKDAIKPFDEVKDKMRNEMYADEMQKQTKTWLEELRRKAHVEVKL